MCILLLLGFVTGAPPATLQGGWSLEWLVTNGGPPVQFGPGAEPWMTIRGNQLTFYNQSTAGLVSVDESKRPRTIDVTYVRGPDTGKTLLGIWKCEDGVLSVCSARIGDPGPTDFTAPRGSHRKLGAYKRHPGPQKPPDL
jgi:uncharacterized protein (TIGR03067 family)